MTGTSQRSKASKAKINKMRAQMLTWYDEHARDLPWRVKGGGTADPYKVWLSEIMLQQTTVQAVQPYYSNFLQKWPSVQDLAAAPQEEIMAAWAGLGYYARARNLHKCAKIVAKEHNGLFPQRQEELKSLPGIGGYTSAAITAIAFQKPATVVDGNIERVMARLFNIKEPLPASKSKLKEAAHLFFDRFDERPGDLAQAFMDLGAGICIVKTPRCPLCPLIKQCQAHKEGSPENLPARIKKKPRPQKYGIVYWVENEEGQVLFHKRPEKGLLGGMLALPTSEWLEKEDDISNPEYLKSVTDIVFSTTQSSQIEHTFTHFDLSLTLKTAELKQRENNEFFWNTPTGKEQEMPSVFKKAFIKLNSR